MLINDKHQRLKKTDPPPPKKKIKQNMVYKVKLKSRKLAKPLVILQPQYTRAPHFAWIKVCFVRAFLLFVFKLLVLK